MFSKKTVDSRNEVNRLELQDEKRIPATDTQKTLQNVMDGLAESVLEMSDEDLFAESREQGRDPKEEAEEVRRILLDALQSAEDSLPSGAKYPLSRK